MKKLHVSQSSYMEFWVPKTGFEPARRFQRYHLKVVRLPISPPGQVYKDLSLAEIRRGSANVKSFC